MAIAKNKKIQRDTINQGIFAVSCFGFVYAVLPLLGFGYFDLHESNTVCYGKGGGDIILHNIYSILGSATILVTFLGLPAIYYKIFVYISEVMKKSAGGKDTSKDTMKILKQFMIITGFFCFCWSFALVVFATEAVGISNPFASDIKSLARFDNLCTFIAISNSALNPLIYGKCSGVAIVVKTVSNTYQKYANDLF